MMGLIMMKGNARQELINGHRLRVIPALWFWSVLVTVILSAASCRRPEQPRAAYVPIAQLEQSYGRLITVSKF